MINPNISAEVNRPVTTIFDQSRWLLCLAVAASVSVVSAKEDRRPPIGLGAKLPASTLRLLDNEKCTIEEVVVAKPWALGGKEINLRGNYLYVCYWQGDGKMTVVDQLGKVRVLPLSMFYPIKD